jgi:hypothetical protein
MGICFLRELTKLPAHWRLTIQTRSKFSIRQMSFPAHHIVPQTTEDFLALSQDNIESWVAHAA